MLISGFKIEVRGWDTHTVVKKLVPHSRSIWSELTLLASVLLGILIFFWRRIVSRYVFRLWEPGTLRDTNLGVRVGRVPVLSQVSTLTQVTGQMVDEQPSSLFTLPTSSTITYWTRLVVKYNIVRYSILNFLVQESQCSGGRHP